MKAQFRTKLEDTFTPTIIRTGQHSPSRIEEYWKENGFDKIYKKFRKSALPSTILTKIDIEEIGSYFNLQGYAFGKWATQGDRYNYLAATAICLEDLNRVLHFRNNLGLNHHVGITFGARGRGTGKKGATPKAHYEPGTGVINLTRYKSRNFYLKQKKQPESHEHRFLYTGGVGSLCHELGHAIDFYGGGYLDIDAQTFSLSGGKRPYIGRKAYPSKHNVLRNLLEDVLAAACLKEKGNDFSAYYKRIKNNKIASDSYKEYLLSRTELVARLFEQYVAYQLKEMGIVNTLLTQKNYQPNFYLTSKEFESVVKPFDKFLLAFRKRLNGSAPSSKPTTRRKPKAVVKPKPTTKPVVKPKPTTPAKTITVKIPVTLQTIEHHLWGKKLDKVTTLGKMSDKEFLAVWKYVLAGNAMIRKNLNPSDLFNSNQHILPQVANNGIVTIVQKEFKRRGWEGKYTLFVEVKQSAKTTTKKTNKTVSYDGFKVVHNVRINRLQILFDEKPSEAIRTILKKDKRFWWKDENKAWQRLLNPTSLVVLEKVLKEIQALKSRTKKKTTSKPTASPKPTLPSSKKHADPPHPVDRTALNKAIKSLEGLEQAAISAWNNSSFFPRESGQSFIREHIQELKEDVEVLVLATRRSNIDQYIDLYVRKCQELISSRANVVNWMITGRGGSYNARKVRKKNDRHHDKQKAFWDWRRMRLEKAQAERSTAIRGGTSDTVSQLLEKLDLLQTTQEQMKAVNKLLKSKNTKTLSLKEKITILVKEGFPKDIITRIEESVNGDLHKIPSFYLTNNNANMKRIKDRIAAEEKRQKKYQDGNKTTVFDGLRIVENVEENQLQLLFDEKPSEEIRTILKKEGRFRWSRKNRVWQRQLTNNAIYCLKHILKDIVKKK